jgi:hypothetical protein
MLKHHRHPNIGGVPSLKPSLDTKYFFYGILGRYYGFAKYIGFRKVRGVWMK